MLRVDTLVDGRENGGQPIEARVEIRLEGTIRGGVGDPWQLSQNSTCEADRSRRGVLTDKLC